MVWYQFGADVANVNSQVSSLVRHRPCHGFYNGLYSQVTDYFEYRHAKSKGSEVCLGSMMSGEVQVGDRLRVATATSLWDACSFRTNVSGRLVFAVTWNLGQYCCRKVSYVGACQVSVFRIACGSYVVVMVARGFVFSFLRSNGTFFGRTLISQ